jgi:hypothetical protein
VSTDVTFDDGGLADDVGDYLPDGLGTPDVDPDAPYGRRPDGTPYRKSKEERDRLAAQLAEGRERARAGGQRPRNAPRTSRASSRPSPRKGRSRAPAPPPLSPAKTAVLGLGQLVSGLLTGASRAVERQAPDTAIVLQADAITVHLYSAPAAEALDELASNSPRLAAFLERVAEAGPYGAAIMVAVPFVAQLAVNHRLAPPVPALGTMTVAEVYASVGMSVPEGPRAEPADHPA